MDCEKSKNKEKEPRIRPYQKAKQWNIPFEGNYNKISRWQIKNKVLVIPLPGPNGPQAPFAAKIVPLSGSGQEKNDIKLGSGFIVSVKLAKNSSKFKKDRDAGAILVGAESEAWNLEQYWDFLCNLFLFLSINPFLYWTPLIQQKTFAVTGKWTWTKGCFSHTEIEILHAWWSRTDRSNKTCWYSKHLCL